MNKWLNTLGLAGLVYFNPVAALAQTIGIGGVANDMLGPINFIRYLFEAGSCIIGVTLLIAAFSRYLRHRQNPQEAPISGVIFWAVLGVMCLLIPFAHYFSLLAAQHTGTANVVN